MGNVSRIGVQRENGMIDTVICQRNSEVENTGRILIENYNSPYLASELVRRGDISELKPYIERGIFDDESRDETTIFCIRDEGRSCDMCKPTLKRNPNSFLRSAQEIGASCAYLFAADRWIYVDMKTGEFEDLEDKVASLGKNNSR